MTKEELKKATGQELIEERNYCGVDGYYSDYLDNVNAEMLKRFNLLAELEQQIEKMQDAKCTSCTELGGMQLKINRLEKENAELKEELAFRRYAD